RKYMMTKMSANGSSDISMPPSPPAPPNTDPCANAGVINIEACSSRGFPGALAALEFRADYNRRAPNCNAAPTPKTRHFQPFPRKGACGRNLAPLRAARLAETPDGQIEVQIVTAPRAQDRRTFSRGSRHV